MDLGQHNNGDKPSLIPGDKTNLFVNDGTWTSIDSYENLGIIGEGAYGTVFRARHKTHGRIVALKRFCVQTEGSEELGQHEPPLNVLREISILKLLKHPNIVNILDIAADGKEPRDVFMAMEYCEQNLASLIDDWNVLFPLDEVKCLAKQLLQGLQYLHANNILHRDIKTENLLLTSHGLLKLADFGTAREYTEGPLTPHLVTLWYRPPELLLGARHYTPAIDMWAAGLVIGELLLCEAVLQGDTENEQLSLIENLVGNPVAEDIDALAGSRCLGLEDWSRNRLEQGRPNKFDRKFQKFKSQNLIKFLASFLKWDPRLRPTASEALGFGTSSCADDANAWWRETPLAAPKENLVRHIAIHGDQDSDK